MKNAREKILICFTAVCIVVMGCGINKAEKDSELKNVLLMQLDTEEKIESVSSDGEPFYSYKEEGFSK